MNEQTTKQSGLANFLNQVNGALNPNFVTMVAYGVFFYMIYRVGHNLIEATTRKRDKEIQRLRKDVDKRLMNMEKILKTEAN